MNTPAESPETPAALTGGESDDSPVLHPERVVETCLYSRELDKMEAFYHQILNLPVIDKEKGRHVFFSVGSGSVLLIFDPDTTTQGHHLPPHGSEGPGHVALGIQADTLEAWRNHLIQRGIFIERDHAWPRGGRSIYFRDPAGNSIELITPRVWGTRDGW